MILAVLAWTVAAGLAFLAASALGLRSWNRFAAAARGPVQLRLPRGDVPTALDRIIGPAEAAHPGLNGLAPLIDPHEAFAARAASVAAAGRSLDIISYIWATDMTGHMLMADLLAAADRGVRVRLLLDDVNVQGFDLAFLVLSQHPRIEVRLFNPLRSRGHWLRRGAEFLLGLSRFNRRMHGKVWIADGRVAILGGRNVADGYFAAPGQGVRAVEDVDLILSGPLVHDLEDLFDSYWNLGLSLPILTLWPRIRLPTRRFRRRLVAKGRAAPARDFRAACLRGRSAGEILAGRLRWTGDATLLADPPDKAFGQRRGMWMSDAIAAEVLATTHELCLTTPYLVPGEAGRALLAGLAARGVAVRVLTNALSTTDLAAVHGAYSHYRMPLLRDGIALHEFAPAGRAGPGRMLHSKVFVFDRSRAMVGSYNFDLRSSHTNIELGLLVGEPQTVAELVALFDRQTAPDQAMTLAVRDGRLAWQVQDGAASRWALHEPGAGLLRRIAARIIARLPHDLF
ncbi:MAG TPA: phospholipase D family protein [Paracoccaceae bacterium]|nr:phospholipase D family protein [Paracoccaceae bacterium]